MRDNVCECVMCECGECVSCVFLCVTVVLGGVCVSVRVYGVCEETETR